MACNPLRSNPRPLGPHLGNCIKQSIIAGLRRWKPWRPLPSDAEGDDLAIEDCFGQDPAEDAEFEDDKAMVRRLAPRATSRGPRRCRVPLPGRQDDFGDRPGRQG